MGWPRRMKTIRLGETVLFDTGHLKVPVVVTAIENQQGGVTSVTLVTPKRQKADEAWDRFKEQHG